jgi:hypothetical protein
MDYMTQLVVKGEYGVDREGNRIYVVRLIDDGREVERSRFQVHQGFVCTPSSYPATAAGARQWARDTWIG